MITLEDLIDIAQTLNPAMLKDAGESVAGIFDANGKMWPEEKVEELRLAALANTRPRGNA